tara:strand:+ start:2127 stop:2315 length:189 start_codon:yes stop_codon:yes gene_type:complete
MKKIIFFILFFSACSYNNEEKLNNISNNNLQFINFSNDLSFDEFKIKLEEYANSSPYPNIDD